MSNGSTGSNVDIIGLLKQIDKDIERALEMSVNISRTNYELYHRFRKHFLCMRNRLYIVAGVESTGEEAGSPEKNVPAQPTDTRTERERVDAVVAAKAHAVANGIAPAGSNPAAVAESKAEIEADLELAATSASLAERLLEPLIGESAAPSSVRMEPVHNKNGALLGQLEIREYPILNEKEGEGNVNSKAEDAKKGKEAAEAGSTTGKASVLGAKPSTITKSKLAGLGKTTP